MNWWEQSFPFVVFVQKFIYERKGVATKNLCYPFDSSEFFVWVYVCDVSRKQKL